MEKSDYVSDTPEEEVEGRKNCTKIKENLKLKNLGM